MRAAGGLSRRWHTPGRPVGTGSAVLCPLCTDCKRWFRCVRHGIRGDNRGVMLCEGWSKGLQMNTAPEKESPGLWRVPQIGGLSVSVRDIVRLMRCARQSNPTHSKSCCHYAPDFCTRKASWNQSVIFRAKILISAQVGQVDTTRAKPKRSYVSPSTGTPCPPRCRPRGGLLCLSGSQASAASTPCSCARTDRS